MCGTKADDKSGLGGREKDIVIQVSRSKDAVSLLKEATYLISYDLEGTIDIFTSCLSHISQRMKKTKHFVVRNEPFRDPFWFDRECQNKKKTKQGEL